MWAARARQRSTVTWEIKSSGGVSQGWRGRHSSLDHGKNRTACLDKGEGEIGVVAAQDGDLAELTLWAVDDAVLGAIPRVVARLPHQRAHYQVELLRCVGRGRCHPAVCGAWDIGASGGCGIRGGQGVREPSLLQSHDTLYYCVGTYGPR